MTKRTNLMRYGLGAAMLLALTAGAAADSVDMKFLGTGLGRSVKVETSTKTFNVFAGQLRHELDNGDGALTGMDGELLTYCTELTQYVTSSFKDYDLVNLSLAPDSGPMGAVKAQAIRDIFAYAAGAQYESASNSANKDFSAAFQIAIWEIVADYDGTNGSLSVTDGELEVRSTNGSALASGIAGELDDIFAAVGLGADFPQLGALVNANHQDQLVMVPLPAPLLIGMAGVAGVMWRRRRLAARQSAA